jgi:hypothetical protein
MWVKNARSTMLRDVTATATVDVRFRSKADIATVQLNVRFTPEIGHSAAPDQNRPVGTHRRRLRESTPRM